MVHYFSQCFCRRHPYGYRYAYALQYGLPHTDTCTDRCRIIGAGVCKETLVNGIYLLSGEEGSHNRHHPVRQACIKLIVGTSCYNAFPGSILFDGEPWGAHPDPKGPCFAAACYNASVIIGKHNNGLSVKRRIEDALAGGKEAVGVSKYHTVIAVACHFYLPSQAFRQRLPPEGANAVRMNSASGNSQSLHPR